MKGLEASRDTQKAYSKETRERLDAVSRKLDVEVAAQGRVNRTREEKLEVITAGDEKRQLDVREQTTTHFKAIIARFVEVTNANMVSAHSWFEREWKANAEREREVHRLSHEKYGGNKSLRLLRELEPTAVFFVATLQPVTDVRFQLTCTVDDKEVLMGLTWSGTRCKIDGGPDCCFNFAVFNAPEKATQDANFSGGEALGFSRVLKVPGDLSLGAALRAVEAQIFQCKECDGSKPECVHCDYKSALPPSPDFNPTSPPFRECKIHEWVINDDFVLEGKDKSSGSSSSSGGSSSRDKNKEDDRDRDRAKSRSESRGKHKDKHDKR